MKTLVITFLLLVFIFSGCTEQTEKPETAGTETSVPETSAPETKSVTPTENSQTASGWAGSYSGILPCADCEGIETTLNLNQDQTYSMKMVYMGKDAAPYEENGKISFEAENTKLILNSDNGSTTQYLIGDNSLTQLDGDGNIITGNLADKFILKKSN